MAKECDLSIRERNYVISKKKLLTIFLIAGILALTILFFTNKVSADTPANSYCCEKLQGGGWCQNVNDISLCATGNGLSTPAPTSCQSTSYCRLGTCVNPQEGTCLPNVPSQVCQNSKGTWFDGTPSTIPQCKLGCCFIGDQTAFVTQTRCKNFAGVYGVNTTFRTDITDETTCIESANPQQMGACVLDNGVTRNCRLLSRGDCQQLQTASSGNTTVEFHEGLLCTAETLNTECAPTKNTECVPGQDQVYFVDSCGNMANVYDSSKLKDPTYWTNIIDPSASCNPGSSNAGSSSCGNCNYLAGSTCKPYQRGNQQTPNQPSTGNFVCADLSCHYNGKVYSQGSSWCVTNTQGASSNSPGSEYAVQRCFNGEVTTELCDPYRNQVCLQGSLNGSSSSFPVAECAVNRWEDCTVQTNEQDCLNTDQRDCKWVNLTSATDENGNPVVVNSNGTLVPQGQGQKFYVGTVNVGGFSLQLTKEIGAACVPEYSPGFVFWNGTQDSKDSGLASPQAICAQANQKCVVKFTRNAVGGFLGISSWSCQSGCECVGLSKGAHLPDINAVSQWINQRMGMCVSIGDCGNKTNYIGNPGYNSNINNFVTISKGQ